MCWQKEWDSNAQYGFADEAGNPFPGVSTFHRAADGTIRHGLSAPFGPGDKFCSVWSFFELLAPQSA